MEAMRPQRRNHWPETGRALRAFLDFLAHSTAWASHVAPVVKNQTANVGDVRDAGSVPGLGRSPGGGHGNPLQHSCLENPMDRGAWRATVHRVAKSQTQPFGCAKHSLQRTEAEDMEGTTWTGIDALPLPQTCRSPWNFDVFSGTGRGWRADRSRWRGKCSGILPMA